MKIKKSSRLLLGILLLILSVCGCTGKHDTDHTKELICSALEINKLPTFEIVDSFSKTHNDGSIETYSIITFDEDASAEFERTVCYNWQYAPVSSKYMNFTDYASIIPDAYIDDARRTLTKLNDNSDNRWVFIDKTSEFERKFAFNIKEDKKKYDYTTNSNGEESYQSGYVYIFEETDPRTPLYAVGFSCAFYEADTKTLYVYSFEPAYDSKYLKYLQ